MANLWDCEETVESFDIYVPAWIEQDISAYDIAAINQGGCASGAYMPAVTYHKASQIMAEHGDDVLDYIVNAIGEPPTVTSDMSWGGIACMYLSYAVELWASSIEEELSEAIDNMEEVE